MYKFDVKYTFENYLEYYKFVLIKQRIVRDCVFAVFFFAIAAYWWIEPSENTANNFLPIFAIVMGLVFPLMNLVTLPMLKKQLRARQAEIDRTHIIVTFEDDEIVYENLTIKPEDVKPADELSETPTETPVEENKEERVFKLKYQNFLNVKETEGLFLFYLDKQTVIILPKETYQDDKDLSEFKNFILSKINPKRVKFLKK